MPSLHMLTMQDTSSLGLPSRFGILSPEMDWRSEKQKTLRITSAGSASMATERALLSRQQWELESCAHVLALRSRFSTTKFYAFSEIPSTSWFLDGLNLLLVTFCMCRRRALSPAICYTNSSKLHLDRFSGVFVNDQKKGIALAVKAVPWSMRFVDEVNTSLLMFKGSHQRSVSVFVL